MTLVPTPGEVERLRTALIQKAARFLILHNDPLGFGDIGEFGPVSVRPDYPTREMLYGLHAREWPAEALAVLVTPNDVIRNVFGVEVDKFPTDRIPDVQREIDAAADFIEAELNGAFGVA
jgi:hypothetical protein